MSDPLTTMASPHSEPDTSPRSMAWLIVGLLWVVAALNYLDRIMVTTMRDSLTAAIPMTDAQFGLPPRSYSGSMACSVRSPVFSRIALIAVG